MKSFPWQSWESRLIIAFVPKRSTFHGVNCAIFLRSPFQPTLCPIAIYLCYIPSLAVNALLDQNSRLPSLREKIFINHLLSKWIQSQFNLTNRISCSENDVTLLAYYQLCLPCRHYWICLVSLRWNWAFCSLPNKVSAWVKAQARAINLAIDIRCQKRVSFMKVKKVCRKAKWILIPSNRKEASVRSCPG